MFETAVGRQRRLACAGLVLLCAAASCSDGATTPLHDALTEGRLVIHAAPHVDTTVSPGLYQQDMTGETRQGGVYVPSSYDTLRTWPLAILLHPSGGSGIQVAEDFKNDAEANGIIIVAPSSHAYTWDRMATGTYGVDVAAVDEALEWATSRFKIDPTHIAIAGFSDGATYSVLLGLKNGDVFTHVLAFSECAKVPDGLIGSPRLFIGHGTQDQVLPINECSRRLVPDLLAHGYTVDYLEYPSPHADGHYVPEDISLRAFAWFTQP